MVHQYVGISIIIIIIINSNYGISESNNNALTLTSAFPKLLFVCKSGGVLDMRRICDGRIDCYDGSDEIYDLCYRTLCPMGTFRCQYGACVDKSKKCNGIRDCADGTDEEQCGRRMNSCA